MTTRQTRRQAAKAAKEDGSSPSGKSDPASQEDEPAAFMNGNGKARAAALPDPADTENIFLFWPNIIGNASQRTCSCASRPTPS